jgi:ABC-2 type transport system permease protein
VNAATYTRYEVVRAFRNRRFFIFSIGFPLVLYFVIAAPNRDVHDFGGSGIDAPLYLMVGLTAFGTMNAVLGVGARIAAERSTGWNRQLRLTPLTSRAYFRTKVLTAYLTAMVTIVLLYAAGALLGVRIPAGRWFEMTLLMLIGLVPFAALGILIGHLIGLDSIGPAMGGTTALLGLLGGVWFPIDSTGFMHDVAVLLPSYWLVQASHVAIGGGAWRSTGWLVVAVWSVLVAVAAAWAYRRDTSRY